MSLRQKFLAGNENSDILLLWLGLQAAKHSRWSKNGGDSSTSASTNQVNFYASNIQLICKVYFITDQFSLSFPRRAGHMPSPTMRGRTVGDASSDGPLHLSPAEANLDNVSSPSPTTPPPLLCASSINHTHSLSRSLTFPLGLPV